MGGPAAAPLRGPAHVDVGLAGTVMRFLPPVAALADGPVTFDGDPQARERPLGPLVAALRTLGVRIDAAPSGGLPLTVHGTGGSPAARSPSTPPPPASSSPACCSPRPRFTNGSWCGTSARPCPSAPHLRMTVQMLRAAGAAVDDCHARRLDGRAGPAAPGGPGTSSRTSPAPRRSWPPRWSPAARSPCRAGRAADHPAGDQLRDLLTADGRRGHPRHRTGLTVRGTGVVHGIDADLSDVSELTPVLAALAALADSPSRLRGRRRTSGATRPTGSPRWPGS